MARTCDRLPSISTVIRMAVNTAKTLGITIPNTEYLRGMISKQIPIPQVYRNDKYMLWVDRYYIAFQYLIYHQPVEYIYVTKQHIFEEVDSESFARKHKRKYALDAPTRAQFAAAWEALEGSCLGFVTRKLKPTSGEESPMDLGVRWRSGYRPDKKTAPA